MEKKTISALWTKETDSSKESLNTLIVSSETSQTSHNGSLGHLLGNCLNVRWWRPPSSTYTGLNEQFNYASPSIRKVFKKCKNNPIHIPNIMTRSLSFCSHCNEHMTLQYIRCQVAKVTDLNQKSKINHCISIRNYELTCAIGKDCKREGETIANSGSLHLIHYLKQWNE